VLLVAAGLLLAAQPIPGAGEERPFGTIVALGGSWPVDSAEGLPSPLVRLDHESEGHFGAGTLNVLLDTVVLTAALEHRLSPRWAGGYGVRGTKFVEGYGEDLYRDGRRLESETFTGDSFAATLSGTLAPDGPWSGRATVEGLSARFRTTRLTRPNFTLPGGFHQQQLRLEGWRGRLLADGRGEARIALAEGWRPDWRGWSLDEHPQASDRFRTQVLRIDLPVGYGGGHSGRWRLSGLDGRELDLFSAFRVGGFAGAYPVAGYYRNEFRARSAAVLNAEHELALAGDRKLTFFLDGAWLRRIEPAWLEGSPRHQTLLGVGIGFFYGIRALGGLPLIFRYGEGLRIPAGSPERYRREILAVLAAGF
jgi:hypothetical protein